MEPDGFNGVLRTARLEPATAQRSKQEGLARRKDPLIDAQSEYQNKLNWIHLSYPIDPFNNLALCRVVKKSFSTVANCFPAIDARATSTMSTGRANSC